ncbi:uncharacterized protein LOC143180309, partial [Calliopsis andreniformis]|uniref:uncharacterized protein LOC143180309 n=1 Tax=Calliopsis andreniformis TaxID=337506 RepID=UPI003FCE4D9C
RRLSLSQSQGEQGGGHINVSSQGSINSKKCEEHKTQASNEKPLEFTKKVLQCDRSNKFVVKSFSKRKFSRSSLTLEPDKIMINLPKCSPCAYRLAASSKILSNDTGIFSRFTINRESPLHIVRSKSSSHIDVHTDVSSKTAKKTSVQVNLFSNIRQSKKTPPRSKSVGELCNATSK